MTKYVCGFMFNEDLSQVALIVKNKPEWQKGVLNGIGGKIEIGESGLDAMIREFKEETGLHYEDWRPLLSLREDDWQVLFFFAKCPHQHFADIDTTTDEEVLKANMDYLPSLATIDNLQWLVPMAEYFLRKPTYIFSK